MIIRKKREGDLNFIMSIASSTGSEPDEIKEILKRDEIYVAEVDGQLIGFTSLKKNESILEITELAVAPQFQNKGFARELLTYVRELASLRGVKELWVRTSNDNIPALTLYQKFGFRILNIKLGALVEHHGGEILGWEGIPVRDEITLRLKLDNLQKDVSE